MIGTIGRVTTLARLLSHLLQVLQQAESLLVENVPVFASVVR